MLRSVTAAFLQDESIVTTATNAIRNLRLFVIFIGFFVDLMGAKVTIFLN
jgi:hypothetical protein